MRDDIKPSEILEVLKQKLTGFGKSGNESEVGKVIQSGDGIIQVWGLDSVMSGELVEVETETHKVIPGLVMNIEEDTVGIFLFSDAELVKEGQLVRRTKRVAEVPVGESLLGRVVDPLGNPIDGLGPIIPTEYRKVEAKGPGIIERQNVTEPMQTGLKAIDAMIPIGRGQRELIIGDRRTGKTAIAIDTILNQKSNPEAEKVHCFYVAIGQKRSSVVQLVENLRKRGSMEYTTVVAATTSDPASLQFLAPYSATAMAEYFRDNGKHALIIYDDLTKHSQAYRELSLLMRRSPGREAYPGDIFYIHSRLLERAAKMSAEKGGGSLTALPIVETQDGDVSAYIPTNVISITDGQIFLEAHLFNSGLRPAINVGISVSRVGGDAQVKAIKQTAGTLRIELAQFRELAAFMQFSSDLDAATKNQLSRGERLTEILKQKQFAPIDIYKQAILLKAGISGRLDKYPTNKLMFYQNELFGFLDSHCQDFLTKLSGKSGFTPELDKELLVIFDNFELRFHPEASTADIDAGYTLNIALAMNQSNSGINRETLSMIERVTSRELASPSLEQEIGDIMKGDDTKDKDRFDTLLESCKIIDMEKGASLEKVFQKASRIMVENDPELKSKILEELLQKREKTTPTALTPFFALPHIVVEGYDKFQMFLMRSKTGIKFSETFPAIHAAFFLAGSMDQRHLHLVIISSLAQIVRDPSFEAGWLSAPNTESVRTLLKTIRSSRKK